MGGICFWARTGIQHTIPLQNMHSKARGLFSAFSSQWSDEKPTWNRPEKQQQQCHFHIPPQPPPPPSKNLQMHILVFLFSFFYSLSKLANAGIDQEMSERRLFFLFLFYLFSLLHNCICNTTFFLLLPSPRRNSASGISEEDIYCVPVLSRLKRGKRISECGEVEGDGTCGMRESARQTRGGGGFFKTISQLLYLIPIPWRIFFLHTVKTLTVCLLDGTREDFDLFHVSLPPFPHHSCRLTYYPSRFPVSRSFFLVCKKTSFCVWYFSRHTYTYSSRSIPIVSLHSLSPSTQ